MRMYRVENNPAIRCSEDTRSGVGRQSCFEETHFVQNDFHQKQMKDNDQEGQSDPEENWKTTELMTMTMQSENIVAVRRS